MPGVPSSWRYLSTLSMKNRDRTLIPLSLSLIHIYIHDISPAGLPFRIVKVHGDDLVQVSYFRFVQIVFGNGDIRFADTAFGGVFPCGKPHVGLSAVGTAIYLSLIHI